MVRWKEDQLLLEAAGHSLDLTELSEQFPDVVVTRLMIRWKEVASSKN